MADQVVVVEGDGEVVAMPKLLAMVSADLALPGHYHWHAVRAPRALRDRAALEQTVDLVLRLHPRCARVLVTGDLDDGCPKSAAPALAAALAARSLRVPVALVFMYREFETLFLAAADGLAGRVVGDAPHARQVRGDARTPDDPQATRGAKEAVRRLFVGHERFAYKPTVHQAMLTGALHLETLRSRQFVGEEYTEPGLPCFRSLERAVRFLAEASPGAVYPVAVADSAR